ncbi:phage major capsid protein [Streptomyces sp. MBT67]|uniref:phage major capsid protein n=1 Tax=unclassified Streptomyces TaxID=2593676 RepID=UPI00190BF379|nr:MULTISPECIES: phage major capsid protein [unclassified Streptomyces]MBK3532434.1 phage major capsid protein [Streptomyces sp. MBT72]MBK3538226.1 phage major capsid protein [Streptomyces sp. MBT67]MBK3551803.1 phage major capsid protein [Streptomyces sp. MBT61]MBK6030239.1 phage major capsid protein [Streptomyces sp. MBT59]MBK6046465.1 phage major capsid protein [Streptomyces sp. MBT55]
MKTELRKIFDSAESEDRGLSAREIAAMISKAGDSRQSVLAVINQAKANTPEGRDALRSVFADATEARQLETRVQSESDSTYLAQARGQLMHRNDLTVELRKLNDRETLHSESDRTKRYEEIENEMRELLLNARDFVERGEREAEVRSLSARSGGLLMPSAPKDEDEWRSLVPSLSEYRAISGGVASEGGYTVPSGVSGKYIDALKSKSTFLRGLPESSVIPFASADFSVPQLVSSTGADYVAEGQVIPEGQMVWGEVKFTAKKIGEIQWASSEVLEDSAVDQRRVIADNLLRDASLKFDADAFVGSGSNPVKGIISQGVTTTLGAGRTTVTYDDLADAVARIEATNGTPSVVWASVDTAAALRKEKAAGSGVYQGGSPTDAPAATAWGLPILPSTFLPAKTVIVADASRVIVGIRRNATIRISEDARFDRDQTGFRLTMRMAGVSVAEAPSVQIIKAANS